MDHLRPLRSKRATKILLAPQGLSLPRKNFALLTPLNFTMELEHMKKNSRHDVETVDRDSSANEGSADTVYLSRTGKKQVLKVKASTHYYENSRLK